ncbi:hypothetical protein O3M35_007907 [Rhynocoris fuscipes]|uniref:Phosphoglycerate kinase n=1 Tax=Rhynocoris fuscipes TaxID=488301 RepID=A0AAW1DAZ6_9HEMI
MIFNKLSIDNVNITGKRILMRVHFSVPLKDGKIVNDQRIVASLDTIKYALEKNAKSIVLLTHIGRPQGRKIEKFSLKPLTEHLGKLLNRDIIFLNDCVGGEVEVACADPEPGSVFLLENVRFHLEEEGQGLDEHGNKIKADPAAVKQFRQSLRKLGDIYVNDAFGNAHRAHSSMIAEGFELKVAGLLMKKELEYFAKVLDKPQQPFVAILGGAKIVDKIPLIENLLDKVTEMIICGGMALTFLKEVKNMQIGASLYDKEVATTIQKLMCKASERNVTIHFPVDFIAADRFDENARTNIVSVHEGIAEDWMGLDIGPQTCTLFDRPIKRAKLILWNGPAGVFEFDKFSNGSRALFDSLIEATSNGCLTIVGGGDTATCAAKFNAEHKLSYVSTGGGATLQLLQGKPLPGVAALCNA